MKYLPRDIESNIQGFSETHESSLQSRYRDYFTRRPGFNPFTASKRVTNIRWFVNNYIYSIYQSGINELHGTSVYKLPYKFVGITWARGVVYSYEDMPKTIRGLVDSDIVRLPNFNRSYYLDYDILRELSYHTDEPGSWSKSDRLDSCILAMLIHKRLTCDMTGTLVEPSMNIPGTGSSGYSLHYGGDFGFYTPRELVKFLDEHNKTIDNNWSYAFTPTRDRIVVLHCRKSKTLTFFLNKDLVRARKALDLINTNKEPGAFNYDLEILLDKYHSNKLISSPSNQEQNQCQ